MKNRRDVMNIKISQANVMLENLQQQYKVCIGRQRKALRQSESFVTQNEQQTDP